MNIEDQIQQSLMGLKDFQRKTVDIAVQRLQNGQSRFLIADEVGLGKTVVARGIITRLVAEYYRQGKMLNVIYICSNKALAKQNLSKLSYARKSSETDEDYKKVIHYSQEDDRITSLAYAKKTPKNKYHLNIRALTPATSFDNGNLGRADERILLFRILSSYEEFRYRHIALKWFLKGGKSANRWHNDVEYARDPGNVGAAFCPAIRSEVYAAFKRELKSPLNFEKFRKLYNHYEIDAEISLWKFLLLIIEEGRQNRSFFGIDSRGNYINTLLWDFGPMHFQLVAQLRFKLSIVCKEFLKADLFVLDEFQRYSNLIQTGNENDDPGTFIAKSIFSKPDAKIVMLSATPFKAYTTAQDEAGGENHYREFRQVLNFLLQEQNEMFWQQLNEENAEYFKTIRHFENGDISIERLRMLKKAIENKYRVCMARTERTLVEKVEAGMIDSAVRPMQINKEDIIDFIKTDEIVKAINDTCNGKLPVPIEYVKSSPFPFSFLQDYEHMKKFQETYSASRKLRQATKKAKRAWLPVERINEYKALLPESATNRSNEPNAKLRFLYEETVRNKGWQLLWIPPSLNYYNAVKGAFVNAEDFSKTLIFSKWKMVPRMVSALVSYEAERLSVGKHLEKIKRVESRYNDKKRYPAPLLTFKNTDGKLAGMNNLMLSYPSISLANIYDPASNISEKRTLGEIKSTVAAAIKKRLLQLNVLSLGYKEGDYQKWEWYAILLMDRKDLGKDSLKWLDSLVAENDYDGDEEKQENGKTGRQAHILELRKCLTEAYEPNLGKLNIDQLDNLCIRLANVALGAPGICCYRSLAKQYNEDKTAILLSAFIIGQGFNSLFNKPESIAVVNEFENEKSFHENVIQYAISGNIQAMLDEFVYQLKDSGGMDNAADCATFIRDILTVNPGSIEAKHIKSFDGVAAKGFNIRTHYAIPFGLGSASELKNGARQIKVREAFNSPFRPFVLTSTSIGQEGLDFHYYCSKLIHWNLPSNPIDLEQREGRIKRYKGLNIRRSLAKLVVEHLHETNSHVNVWDQIFNAAVKMKPQEQCDLVPFWHVVGDNENGITSIIPLYRYSKDFDKLKYIKSVLANYRLAFGQPRQEELIYALTHVMQNPEALKSLKSLTINLAPISYI